MAVRQTDESGVFLYELISVTPFTSAYGVDIELLDGMKHDPKTGVSQVHVQVAVPAEIARTMSASELGNEAYRRLKEFLGGKFFPGK
jgi:hypothetical protein